MPRSRRWSAGVVAVLLGSASACGGGGSISAEAGSRGPSGSGAGTVLCEPLASVPAKTIALGKILGVGRDDGGTLYVADRAAGDTEPRAFAGRPGMLVRQRVIGSGESDQGSVQLFVLSWVAQGTSITLALELSPAGTRMATVDAVTKAPSFDELPNRHDLVVLAPSALTDTTALDLAVEAVIEYVAMTKTGEVLLVIRPRDNWSYGDFRVFYGTPPQLSERHVDSVTRALDGGTTTIVFELGGSVATAFFPVMFSPDAGIAPGPATLKLSGQMKSLERFPAEQASLGGAKLLCLR